MTYTPRRQNARWLDSDCPRGVLAIYDDSRTFDRFTVFYATPIVAGDYAKTVIGYRGMSESPCAPNGFGMYGEMSAYEAANYRYANRNRACKWSDLPLAVQELVRRDCEDLESDNA